jgi:hypothetical protein
MIREIANNEKLARIASAAVKKCVDDIYGYSKYSSAEIRSELEDRLYCMTYLGWAINDILKNDSVKEKVKVRLASGYIGLLEPYASGHLPKEVYKYWEDMEPAFVIEIAAFLDARGLFDWSNKKQIEYSLNFASHSGMLAKKALLASLIDKLNKDRALSQFLSKDLLHSSEVFALESRNDRGRFSPLRLDHVDECKQILLLNLAPLFDADYRDSSFRLICDLSCLTKDDLIWFFVDITISFFTRNFNRLTSFRDLGKGLVARGIPLISLIQKLDEKWSGDNKSRSFYFDEVRVRVLAELAENYGQCDSSFVDTVRRFLKHRMETNTREYLFKFVYRHSGDRTILEEALQWKSAKIRSWAQDELAKLGMRGHDNTYCFH